VPNLALIASSIMSKKLAAGADVIVLDVKTGSGAFVRERESAIELAKAMIGIGTAAGRRMAAVVSDMSQPLGRAIGNALEVAEALDTLENNGPPDFTLFTVELATLIVDLASSSQTGRADVEQALRSGAARDALRRMIEAQGGDTRAFDDRSQLPTANVKRPVLADAAGFVSQLDALTVARASIVLGAGRERKGDPIDLAVGVRLGAKIGDRVSRGEPLAVLHANDESRLPEAERILRGGIQLSTTRVRPPPVILERLGASAASPA
jgi:pyrimidine-nucleoside phosphorylase